jgi:hypothetical protein
MEKYKKSDITEIIDSDDIIIGKSDTPENSPDMETRANRTTDANVRARGQNYKNDFLGRFGFYFYESDGDNINVEKQLASIMYEKYKETLNHYHENPEKIHKDWELHQGVDFDSQPEDSREHDYEWAKDILKALEPHMKTNINEGSVVEDKITDKKEDEFVKKDSKGISKKKIEDVADLLNKLPKAEIDKLINLLEN